MGIYLYYQQRTKRRRAKKMAYMTKEQALREYKEAREQVLADYNENTWKAFCEAKLNCMRLGVRI